MLIKTGKYQLTNLIKANQIYQEDCMTFMEKLKDEGLLVDVIVTSPPYNINKEYGAYRHTDRKRLFRMASEGG